MVGLVMLLTPRVTLSIAGSDSSGGAGVQRDNLVSSMFRVHCANAVTAITAQDGKGAQKVQWAEPDVLAAQIECAFRTFSIGAVKTGLLGRPELIRTVARTLARQDQSPPVIVDPISAASTGTQFWEPGALDALKEHLFPLATLITPNLPESAKLIDSPTAATQDIIDWAFKQPFAVLIKGGHGEGQTLVDHLIWQSKHQTWSHRRIKGPSPRGTGCALSAAICANLVKGASMPDAIDISISWLQKSIHASVSIGTQTMLGTT